MKHDIKFTELTNMPRKRCIFGIVKPTKILAVMKITPAVPKPLSNSDILGR